MQNTKQQCYFTQFNTVHFWNITKSYKNFVLTYSQFLLFVENSFWESEEFDAKESETSYLWLDRSSITNNLVVYLWVVTTVC